MELELTGQFTTAGADLLAGALAGTSLTVTRVLAGRGRTQASDQALDQPVQQLEILPPGRTGQVVTMQVTLAAALAPEPYSFTELGVYVRDAQLGEVLFQIYRISQPVEISPQSRLVLRSTLHLAVSGDLQFTAELPLDGFVVREELAQKADLVDGQVPYDQMHHLTATRDLYVDAAAGDDANDGTEERPFRTIQKAVDSLPRFMTGGRAEIHIAAGTYREDISLVGFTGSASYNPAVCLLGAGIGQTTIQGRIYIACASPVWLDQFSLVAGASGKLLEIYFTTVRMDKLAIDASGAPNAQGAVLLWFGSLHASDVQVDHGAKAAFSLIGTAFLKGISGQGNTVGVIAGASTIGHPALVVADAIPDGFAGVKYQKNYGSAVLEKGVLV